ncbi:MAG: GNAT family N-acetyltransferase [Candidatus Bipolaricaulota bacterium]
MSTSPSDPRQAVGEMLDLALAFPEAHLHTADLPYRFASWALDEPENVALWRDGGRLVGWAVIQAPFWMLDFAFRPDTESDLLPEALRWADRRAKSVRGTIHERPQRYVTTFSNLEARLELLERHGYACQADVVSDSWSRVLLRRVGAAPERCEAPAGFAVRAIDGQREIDAYVDLHRTVFESKNMTSAWRSRTLSAPHHLPEADLVATAADGRLAGFCIGWLAPSSGGVRIGQIEPLGVDPGARGLGLGSVLLAECARRLIAAGAIELLVETDTYRAPALDLYESFGFRPLRDVVVYRKEGPA